MLSDHVQAVMPWESRAPDTQVFSQAREHAHDEFDEGTLPMKDRAEGLQKIAVPDDTQQLPPGTAIGMAIDAEIPPTHAVLVSIIGVGIEIAGDVDLASAPSCHGETRRGHGLCSAIISSAHLWMRIPPSCQFLAQTIHPHPLATSSTVTMRCQTGGHDSAETSP